MVTVLLDEFVFGFETDVEDGLEWMVFGTVGDKRVGIAGWFVGYVVCGFVFVLVVGGVVEVVVDVMLFRKVAGVGVDELSWLILELVLLLFDDVVVVVVLRN